MNPFLVMLRQARKGRPEGDAPAPPHIGRISRIRARLFEAGRRARASAQVDDPAVGRTLWGAACLAFQPLLLNALSVPVMAYIIHRLGPEGYAQWMVSMSLLAVGGVLTNLGLRAAFIRRIAAEPASAGAALAEQLGMRLSLAVISGVLVVGAGRLLGYAPSVLWCCVIGAVSLCLATVAATLADLLQSLQRMAAVAGASLAAGLVLTGCSVLAAWRSADPVLMSAAYVTGPALSAALLLRLARRELGPVRIAWSLASCVRLAGAARHFATQQLLFAASTHIESLMLPRLIGMSQFGVFTAGAMPASRAIAIPDGLAAAIYPSLVQACARGPAIGARVVRLYALVGAAGAALVALALMVAAEPIGRLLLPGHAEAFAMVVRITIWSLPLTALELVMGYSLNACGKDAVQARLALPAAAASLLCSVALVSAFGLTGACWSMVLRPAVRGAFLAPVVFRTFSASPSRSTPAANILASMQPTLLRKAG